MTTKYKSLTSRSSIHPRLSEAIRGRQSITGSKHTPFIIYGKGSHYPTNTIVQKNISNKSDIYRKHMRNNEIYMFQYEAIRCNINFL
ncbi:hypothetical protein B296_00000670 [Ensete ventricosum]|uniref:Uncharacterized protein n=1 Tax=Ensete ventricosum TaxID=4639 RepID=A0A426Z0T1_ENSVE|nr:hypothetical protein B296_00000670 [Ensete ventricosum]